MQGKYNVLHQFSLFIPTLTLNVRVTCAHTYKEFLQVYHRACWFSFRRLVKGFLCVFYLLVYFVFFLCRPWPIFSCLFCVVSTSASDCLERLVSEMTCYVTHWVPPSRHIHLYRVYTTPGNPANLLEFKNLPGNLLEFNWSSWKFLCKMSTIDRIGFQSKLGSRSLI